MQSKQTFISAFSIYMTVGLSSPKFLILLVTFTVHLSFSCGNILDQNNEDTEAATSKYST